MIAQMFIDQLYPVSRVLRHCGISHSSFYYSMKPATSTSGKRGIAKSLVTEHISGKFVSNAHIVEDIKKLLQGEFVDYGYVKVTYYLQNKLGYLINHKKVYRLMHETKLLNTPNKVNDKSRKQWVKDLVPEPTCAFSYWEFDIKFLYVKQERRYIPLLSVIDVYSRYLLGYMFQPSIKQHDVVGFFEALINDYNLPQQIYVRNDNGSQFESKLVRDYMHSKGIIQEFTRPATPQQNAHIESYHSIINSAICRRIELESLQQTTSLLQRWEAFYNDDRIHSGITYMSPKEYLASQQIMIPNKYKQK